jgi:hypothetical protein
LSGLVNYPLEKVRHRVSMSSETNETNDRAIRPDPGRTEPGLCGTCQHARRIESDRGSIFIMCELSFEDSQFAKYPRLPVLVCSGYLTK